MAIQMRELGVAQKRAAFVNWDAANLATGTTAIIAAVPCASSLDGIQVMANGLSGTPVYQLWVQRFIVGTGFTTFAVGNSFNPVEYGTSGVLSVSYGVSLPQIGSTLTTLQQNDLLVLVSAGSNTAVKALSVNIALRPLTDVFNFFGLLG